jgi:hypothetical protein
MKPSTIIRDDRIDIFVRLKLQANIRNTGVKPSNSRGDLFALNPSERCRAKGAGHLSCVEVLGGSKAKLLVMASSHGLHGKSASMGLRGTGHGDLQNRSEQILRLGILNHTLVGVAGPCAQTMKNEF